MKKQLLVFSVTVLASLQAWAEGTALTKIYWARVTAANEVIRVSPDPGAAVLSSVKAGDALQVLTQTRDWYRLRPEGWITKKALQLTGATQEVPAAIATPIPSTKATISRGVELDETDETSAFLPPALRLGAGATFNLKAYGATQTRIESGLDVVEFGKGWVLGIPIRFSFGGGFSTVQGGLDLRYALLRWGSVSLAPSLGATFEHLFGNGRSFRAVNVEGGLKLTYEVNSQLLLTLEPFSVEVAPYNTQSLPMFIRGRVSGGMAWRW